MDQLDEHIECLRRCEILKEKNVKSICDRAKELLLAEANVITMEAPCTVVGDIHGQFYDLLELFAVSGEIPHSNYVFMGDYVDRGFHSIEVLLLLLALKLKYPKRVGLIRGNHESRQITQVYGFYDECLRKYGNINVWRYCTDLFDALPLAAIVAERVFCVHAGLSPDLRTIAQMNSLIRTCEIPHEGPMCDLLWSDPEEVDRWALSPRGAGFLYGQTAVAEFLNTNGLELVCRSHQLVMEGYKALFDDTLVTVWSAPNYCYRCGNVASILELDEYLNKNFKIFEAAPEEAREATHRQVVPEYFL